MNAIDERISHAMCAGMNRVEKVIIEKLRADAIALGLAQGDPSLKYDGIPADELAKWSLLVHGVIGRHAKVQHLRAAHLAFLGQAGQVELPLVRETQETKP